MQQEGKLGPVNHELNLKVFLLLSDKILIPASHLLHARKSDIWLLYNHFSDYFEKDYIYTQLPKEYHAFSDFSYDFLNKYRIKQKKPFLYENSNLLSSLIFPDKQHFRIYNSKAQVDYFYSIMSEQIQRDTKISEKTRQDILCSIYNNSDPNNPLSKTYFDNIIKQLEKKGRRNIQHLKRFSEICYYSAGAYTNNAIISSNAYLDSNALTIINSKANNSYLSSEFYNASCFISILKSLGIIETDNDISRLTFSEILYLKKQKEFQKFLEAYYQLSNSADELENYLKRERKKYNKLNIVKSLLFSFGITINEAILTNYFFEITMNPLLYTTILWLLQAYVENTGFKPIKSLRYYSVDCVLDKIGFGNDFFWSFVIKLKWKSKKAKTCNRKYLLFKLLYQTTITFRH